MQYKFPEVDLYNRKSRFDNNGDCRDALEDRYALEFVKKGTWKID